MIESEKMVQETSQRIKKKTDSNSYYIVTGNEYVRSFFQEVAWAPIFAVFSQLIEKSDERKYINLAIDGFGSCIKLAGFYNMQTERDTFVLSLAKFTNLTVPKEIDEKNIKCIKLMLTIASNYGHVLGSSWLYVIECLTRIDYYTHLGQDDPFYSQRERVSKNPAIEKIEIANAEIIKGSIDLNTIHYIFNKSTNFELNEIIDFITALCKKSE